MDRLNDTFSEQPACKKSVGSAKARGLSISGDVERAFKRKHCHPGAIDSNTAPQNAPNPEEDYNNCKR